MKALINITEQQGKQVVSARELYEFLEISTPFRKWIERMFEYGFEEGVDFQRADIFVRGNEAKDYALSIDCAKEISMIQRNDKGKEARKYFIEVENKALQAKNALSSFANDPIISMRLKQMELDNRVAELEAKTTTRPEFYTIAGYGTLNGITINIKLASRLGREASKLCKEQGIETDEMPDPRFGKVKLYPKAVLNKVFETTL